VLSTGLYYVNYSRNKAPVYFWRTSTAEKGDVNITVTATGTLTADTTVLVGTQVSGIVSKIFVDFNSVVKKNKIIALIDTTFLAATRDDAEAGLEKAVSQYNQAKREFDRTKSLFDQKVSAQADYDLALSNFESAKSAIKSFKAQLNRAVINLQYATIRAPISGTVISRNVDVGQTVIASFNTPTLFSIANDLTKMQVQANVAEADIGQVKEGETVLFTVDAYPDTVFTGHVQQVRLNPVMIQNVVNYIVIVNVSNPDLKLMPGMTANINIKVKSHTGILRITSNALHFMPPEEYLNNSKIIPDSLRAFFISQTAGATNTSKGMISSQPGSRPGYVWVLQGKDVRPVRVSTGLSDGSFIEVEGALKEGDEVVTGINKEQVKSAPKTSNPFMPKMSPRRSPH
jgi:HlyD family secretion protein